jgi:hypothetical protein
MADDVLRLPWRRSRGCCQRIREVARGDLAFDDLPSALSASSCDGRACSQCGEAALRLVDHTGWNEGHESALRVARWAAGHVEELSQDFRLRARGAVAFYLRSLDGDAAVRSLAEACVLVDGASTRERADHYRRSAYVLAEVGLVDAARQAVHRARDLHASGEAAGEPMSDRERDVWEVAVAEMYVEIAVAYLGTHPVDYQRAFQAGREALQSIPARQAPRTFEALVVNLSGLVVTAWRSGVETIDPLEVVREIERVFSFDSRRSDPASTSMRWLWVLCVGQAEGLTSRVRNRLRYVRAGLIAQQRWQDLLWLELDVLWIGAYRSGGRMSRSSLVEVAQKARRAARQAHIDVTAIETFARACRRQDLLSREVMSALFGLRGLRHVKVWDVKL